MLSVTEIYYIFFQCFMNNVYKQLSIFVGVRHARIGYTDAADLFTTKMHTFIRVRAPFCVCVCACVFDRLYVSKGADIHESFHKIRLREYMYIRTWSNIYTQVALWGHSSDNNCSYIHSYKTSMPLLSLPLTQ